MRVHVVCYYLLRLLAACVFSLFRNWVQLYVRKCIFNDTSLISVIIFKTKISHITNTKRKTSERKTYVHIETDIHSKSKSYNYNLWHNDNEDDIIYYGAAKYTYKTYENGNAKASFDSGSHHFVKCTRKLEKFKFSQHKNYIYRVNSLCEINSFDWINVSGLGY